MSFDVSWQWFTVSYAAYKSVKTNPFCNNVDTNYMSQVQNLAGFFLCWVKTSFFYKSNRLHDWLACETVEAHRKKMTQKKRSIRNFLSRLCSFQVSKSQLFRLLADDR